MKYPYMTLMDKTEITHGDVREDGTVLVYIETPVDWGFNSAYCVLPSYEWSEIHGYSETEIARFDKLLHNNAHLIIELAKAGGLKGVILLPFAFRHRPALFSLLFTFFIILSTRLRV